MSVRLPLVARLLSVGLLVVGAACGGGPSGPGLTFGNTGALGGGLGGGGYTAFGFQLPPVQYWDYVYYARGSDQDEPGFRERAQCTTQGFCGLGGQVVQVGTMTDGAAARDTFLVITTANFREGRPAGAVVPVRSSGIRAAVGSVPNAAQYKELRLVVEWAFLSGRGNLQSATDAASIRVRSGNDSTVLFTVSAADLRSGRYAQRAGGCGRASFTNNSITTETTNYATCTDWQRSTVDMTPWLARSNLVLRFVVTEGAPVLTTDKDEPTTFLIRRVTLEGGQ